jgi:hypothetical protein
MSEIDRVYLSIDAHFQCYGNPQKFPEKMQELTGTIVKVAMGAMARYSGVDPEKRDPKVVDLIAKAEAAVRVLDAASKDVSATTKIEDILVAAGWQQADAADTAKNPFTGMTSDKVLTAANFKKAAELAMVARRSLHPLDGESPWSEPIDVMDALRNDDDPYSFSIFDSIVDPIQDLLPPLYQLATEGWVPSEEEGCEKAAKKLDATLRGLIPELIGVSAEDDKIVVYLKSESDKIARHLPDKQDGYDVEVSVFGKAKSSPKKRKQPRGEVKILPAPRVAKKAKKKKEAKVKKAPKCPLCKAKAGKPCVTGTGNKAKKPHAVRAGV